MIFYLNLLAVISLGLIFYSYLFFPFLIHHLSKGKTLHFDHSSLPKVAIIMSAYQEELVIKEKLQSIKAQDYPNNLLSCWIGSDGSMDQTNQIIEFECKNKDIFNYFFFEKRRGKPSVINELVKKAFDFYGDENFILIITDANVIFEKDLVSQITKPFSNTEISVVDSKILPLNFLKKGISVSENFYLSKETKLKIDEGLWSGLSMGTSGGCYAIRSKSFKPVPADFLVDDFFISFSSLLTGGKSVLFQNAICYEEISSSMKVEFNRRRRVSAGNFQNLIYFLPFFSFKQFQIWFVFISHKVIRWHGPLFILILLLTSIFYSFSNFITINYLFVLLFIFSSTLIFDKFLENNNIHLPLLRSISYFLVINVSILFGFFDFIKGIKNNVWEPTKRNQ